MSINLETNIKSDLWSAISSNYASGHYKDAILEAMQFLTDAIRSKTGLDTDGVALAGAALEFKKDSLPVLRINKLQTTSEKDVQKGIHHIVMGLYEAVRNPRSHGQVQDTKDDADAIIYFINYVLKVLDASEEPFTIEGFMQRIYDPDFVENKEYTELLVSEIPPNKRLDCMIGIYRNKVWIDSNRLKLVSHEIMNILSENQLDQFLTIVSDELKRTTDDSELIKTLDMLRPDLWPKISEIARHRIENKLIKSIREGRADKAGNLITSTGSLGTWAGSYLEYFVLKNDVSKVFIQKLQSKNLHETNYIIYHFGRKLLSVVEKPVDIRLCVDALCKTIVEGNQIATNYVRYASFPEEWHTRFEAKLGEGFFPSNVDDIPF